MTKKETLPKPIIGDILLYRDGKSLLTKMIRIFTTSDYNHASIYLGNGEVAESLVDGFQKVKYGDMDNYIDNGIDIYRLRKKIDFKPILREINKRVGTRYGFIDLLKFCFYVITGKKFLKQSRRLICSEAVAVVYREAGFDLFPKVKNLDYISPSDLANNKKLKKIW